MRLISFLLLLFPLSVHPMETDSVSGKYAIYAGAQYGFVIAHRPALRPLQEAHVKGFEFNIARKRDGHKQWEQDFLFPETGIALSAYDLGTDKLGYGVAVYPYLDFPLTQKGQLHFRYGMGVGYIEKIFDKDENYKNAAIGSHWNGVIHLDLHYETAFNNNLFFILGAGLTHFSNGSFEVPNLGINIAHANAGIKKMFGSTTLKRNPTGEKIFRNRFTAISLSGGLKKVYPPFGKQYQVGSLSIQRMYPLRKKSFAGIGADLLYDNSMSGRFRVLKNEQADASDNYRAGIYGAYQLQVGALGLVFNMGYYLYTPWKDDGNIYHRIGLRYEFEKTFLLVNLKTHFARADFFEVGFGVRFAQRNTGK